MHFAMKRLILQKRLRNASVVSGNLNRRPRVRKASEVAGDFAQTTFASFATLRWRKAALIAKLPAQPPIRADEPDQEHYHRAEGSSRHIEPRLYRTGGKTVHSEVSRLK